MKVKPTGRSKKVNCTWIYGYWNKYGFGKMLVQRKNFQYVAFVPEGKEQVKVIDKTTYKVHKV